MGIALSSVGGGALVLRRYIRPGEARIVYVSRDGVSQTLCAIQGVLGSKWSHAEASALVFCIDKEHVSLVR